MPKIKAVKRVDRGVMRIVDGIEQRTPEWHAWRRRFIGASEVATLLGISPWAHNTKELKAQKKGLLEPEPPTGPMRYGIEREASALREYEDQPQAYDLPMPALVENDATPGLAASLDGLAFSDRGFVEVKCPASVQGWMALRSGVPEHYMAQVQAQLLVTGFDEAHLFAVAPPGTVDSQTTVLHVIAYAASWRDRILDAVAAFWEHVDEPDYVVREDSEWIEAVQAYQTALSATLAAEGDTERARSRLMALTSLPAEGHGLRLDYLTVRGRVNYKKIPELKGVSLEAYRGPSTIQKRITRIGQDAPTKSEDE